MTAFVFKIQANMDPNHRDRIAFARLCSGKLVRGMKAKHVRTGKSIGLHTPHFFFAQDRAIADEAYAGDVVGIPNHGNLRIGDTLTEGEAINFVGVPSFAPEIIRRVRLTDAMKAKKLKQALQEMAEEGVVQVFRPTDGSPALIGVVGPLQLDVLRDRLSTEYGLPVEFDVSEFQLARWISAADRKKYDAFIDANRSGIAEDLDGDPVYLARSQFYLDYTSERAPGIVFTDVKDVEGQGGVGSAAICVAQAGLVPATPITGHGRATYRGRRDKPGDDAHGYLLTCTRRDARRRSRRSSRPLSGRPSSPWTRSSRCNASACRRRSRPTRPCRAGPCTACAI